MHQKYSTTLFSQMNEIVNRLAKNNNFYLSFVTILISIVAGSHAAIAQTVSADRNEHRPFDRPIVAHQHFTQGSKNFNIPKGLIAGGERPDDLDERNGKHHSKHHDGKTTGGGKHPEGVLPMPKPKIDDGSGNRPHGNEQHSIMPKPKIDDGSGDRKTLNRLIMPNLRIDDGNGDGKKPSEMAPKH